MKSMRFSYLKEPVSGCTCVKKGTQYIASNCKMRMRFTGRTILSSSISSAGYFMILNNIYNTDLIYNKYGRRN